MTEVDIVEFIERLTDIKLQEWQKETIRLLDETDRDARLHICMPRHLGHDRQMYIYMNAKELLSNGTQNDCK